MRDAEAIVQDAFKCFYPPLNEQKKQLVRLELEALVKSYKEDLASHMNNVTGVVSCVFEDRSEDPFDITFPMPRSARPPFKNSGRKREYAVNLLVYNCRELLMHNNCRFSATGNRTRDPQTNERKYKGRIVKLAALIHELAGFPPRGGWEDRANKASHPNWQHETFYGEGISSMKMSLGKKRFWDSIANLVLACSIKWRICSKRVMPLEGVRTISWSRVQLRRR